MKRATKAPAPRPEHHGNKARRGRDRQPKHGLDPFAVRDEWEATFGRPLPRGMRTKLANECLTYERQVRAERGLSPEAEAYLASLLENAPKRLRRRLKTGTRLVRAWHGRTYTVTAAEDGFVYQNRTYRSLSAIAREITGTAWSGAAFFGLKALGGAHGRG